VSTLLEDEYLIDKPKIKLNKIMNNMFPLAIEVNIFPEKIVSKNPSKL
jgi:hypothetical protein